MDAMPEKTLIAHELTADGQFCTLGVLGSARGVDMAGVDVDDREAVAGLFGIAPALAAEIVFENDEAAYWNETPQARWSRMRQWVQSQIHLKIRNV